MPAAGILPPTTFAANHCAKINIDYKDDGNDNGDEHDNFGISYPPVYAIAAMGARGVLYHGLLGQRIAHAILELQDKYSMQFDT